MDKLQSKTQRSEERFREEAHRAHRPVPPVVEKGSRAWWELQGLLADCVQRRAEAEQANRVARGLMEMKNSGKVAAYTYVIERLGRLLAQPDADGDGDAKGEGQP